MVSAQADSATRPESKYARKLADLREGKRQPFEFKERREGLHPRQRQQVLEGPQDPPEVKRVALEPETEVPFQVRATVSLMYPEKSFAFLEAEDGVRVYLSFKTLRESCRGARIDIGDILDCMAVKQVRYRGLRATRVIRIYKP